MRSSLRALGHLIRRARGSWSDRPPSRESAQIARDVLTPTEHALWSAMADRDKRHSLEVLARFDSTGPLMARHIRAAVLLHDAGKIESGLGFWSRIFATLIGPRGRRFTLYHDHERLGASRARRMGVSEEVLAVLERRSNKDILERFDVADNV